MVLIDGDRNFVGSGWEGGKEHKTLKLNEKNLEYLREFDVIHCGCYADMEDEMIKLKNFRCIRTFDFSSEEEYRTDEYLSKVCPYTDIALFSGEKMEENQVDELQQKVKDYGTELVLITNGIKGQTLFEDSRIHHGMVKLIEPLDTMGAGDSFFTAFVVSLVRSGWKKGTAPGQQAIKNSFAYAAEFSARTCLTEGSFGFADCYE